MRKRSWFDRLLGGKQLKRRAGSEGPRSGEALFYQPYIRRLEDRRVLAAGAIALDAGLDQSGIIEGSSVSLSSAFTDDVNQPHTAQIDWGDGNIETATVNEPTTDPGTIEGSHTYADDGSYTVTVTVTGADLTSVADTLTVDVANQSPENVLLVATPSAINENESITLSGTFEDDGTLDAHTVTIDWGDGSTPEEILLDPNDYDFAASHVILDDPPGLFSDVFTIGVTVEDGDGGIGGNSIDVTVSNVSPTDITIDFTPSPAQEGGLVTLNGTFKDVGTLDTHQVLIDWGDGSLPEFATVTEPMGGDPGTFTLTHTYATTGDYTVLVKVRDNDQQTEATEVLKVENVAPSNLVLSVAPNVIDENSQVTLTATFDDPGQPDQHLVTIDWGDGDVTTFTLAAGVHGFDQTHTYLDDPSGVVDIYDVVVTVSDEGAVSATASEQVQVNNVPPENLSVTLTPSVINEGGTVELQLSFTDVGPLDTHTVEINWGDGSANTVMALPFGQKTFTTTHTYADDDPSLTHSDIYQVTVTVTDDDTGAVTAMSTVEVFNVPPDNLLISLSDLQINEDGTVTLDGSFADPGSLDAHEIEIDWGDGSPPTTILLPVGQRTFSIDHQYLDDNPSGTPTDNYTIDVKVSDDDDPNVFATASTMITVDNVTPTLSAIALTDATIDENGLAEATLTISDPGSKDTYSIEVNWDGVNGTEGGPDVITVGLVDSAGTVGGTNYTWTALTRTLVVTHQYLDDNPTGTTSDNYTLAVKVADDDMTADFAGTLGVDYVQATATLTVANVTPELSAITITDATIDENGFAEATLTITDPGSQDTYLIEVNWDVVNGTEGGPDVISVGLVDSSGTVGGTTYTWTAATRTLVVTHQYLDDNPTGTTSDSYTLAVKVADDDMTANFAGTLGVDYVQATATLTAANVTPVLPAITITDATIDENGFAEATLTINDSGSQDTYQIEVNWDSVNGSEGGPDVISVGLVDSSGSVGGTTYTWTASMRTLVVTHQYLDDNPTGTTNDSYTLAVKVADDDMTADFTGGTDGVDYVEATATLTVANVTPTLSAITITDATIDENGIAEATLTISDPGSQDTYQIEVNWDSVNGTEGGPDVISVGLVDSSGTVGGTTYTWTAATRTLVVTHQYLDDNPTGTTSDSYTLAVKVADDDMTANFAGTLGVDYVQATAMLTVSNVTPTLSAITITDATIDENGFAEATLTITDPGSQDTYQIEVNWDTANGTEGGPDVISVGLADSSGTVGGTAYTWTAATRTLVVTHQYLDDNPTGTTSDSYTLTVKVADDDMTANFAGTLGVDYVQGTATLTVANVTPVLSAITITDATIDENGFAEATLTITDPGSQDTYLIEVNWDSVNGTEGGPDVISVGLVDSSGTVGGTAYTWTAATRTLVVTHQYLDDNPTGTASDSYTLTVKVADDDMTANFAGTVGADYVQATATLTVSNVTPVLSAITITDATIDENGFAEATLTITDPGSQDTYQIEVNWDSVNGTEGGPDVISVGLVDSSGTAGGTTYTWTAATRTLVVTHQYLDDNPTGTTSDSYTLAVKVADDDMTANFAGTLGVDYVQATETLTVSNVTPVLSAITITDATIDENGFAEATLTITDPGNQDTYQIEVNWDAVNGTESGPDVISVGLMDSSGTVGGTTYTWTAATRTFVVTHQYLDDNPTGTTSDSYTLTVKVADDDMTANFAGTLGVDYVQATATLTVSNVTPVLSAITITDATIDENGFAEATLTITDPGSQDTYLIEVNWDSVNGTEGGPDVISVDLVDSSGTVGGTTYTWTAATRTLVVTHQYLDDNPTGTTSDSYTLTVKVADDDMTANFAGGTNGVDYVEATATLTVTNVTPTLSAITITDATIDENGFAEATLTITDPGSQDTYQIEVNWDSVNGTEGGPDVISVGLADSSGTLGGTAYTWTAATRTLVVTHQYLDDNPTGTPFDNYTLRVKVADDDMTANFAGTLGVDYVQATATLTVHNVMPSLNLDDVAAINENGTATLTGTFTDPGLSDVHTILVDWDDPNNSADSFFTLDTTSGLNVGDTFASADGAVLTITAIDLDTGAVGFRVEHLYVDDGLATNVPSNNTPSDDSTISVTVRDDDTGVIADTTVVTVNNVHAVVQLNDLAAIQENNTVTLTGSFTDPGLLDFQTLVVDWDDPNNLVDSTFALNPISDLAAGQTFVSATDGVVLTITTVNGITGEVSFRVQHQYLDDGPSTGNPPSNNTPSDASSISVTVSDDDTGVGSNATVLVVQNVVPTITLESVSSINEDGIATLTGSVRDQSRLDSFTTVVINWGDSNNTADSTFALDTTNNLSVGETFSSSTDGAVLTITAVNLATGEIGFSVQHQYLDDGSAPGNGSPSDTHTISVSITDDDTGVGNTPTTVVVNDMAPSMNSLSATQLDNTGTTVLSGSWADVGTLDTFTIVINWGDGAIETLTMPAGATSFSASHDYTGPPDPNNPGNDIGVTVTVNDDDTLSVSGATLVDVPVDFEFGAGFANITPNAETLDFPVTSNISNTPVQVPPPVSSTRPLEDRRGSVETNIRSDRRVVLKTVTLEGEEGEEVVLPVTTLDNLKSLFNEKPDGRYRIYLRQGNIERLILEVDVRQGKPVDPGDENDGTRDRPPTSQLDLDEEIEPIAIRPATFARDGAEIAAVDSSHDETARLLRALRRRLASC